MKYKFLLVLFSLGLIFSALIATGNSFGSLCGPGVSGCSIVQNSEYAKTFGISNGYWGIIGFLLLIILTIIQLVKPSKSNRRLIEITGTIAGLAAIYFLFIQAFVLCSCCNFASDILFYGTANF